MGNPDLKSKAIIHTLLDTFSNVDTAPMELEGTSITIKEFIILIIVLF